MKLYSFPGSPNALRSRAVIYELEAPVEIVTLNMRAGQNKTPEYLAINPNGKVPVLVDGDLVIWESRAINAYLASKFPQKDLYPADPAQAGDGRPVVVLAGHPSRACDAEGVVRAGDEEAVRHGRAG